MSAGVSGFRFSGVASGIKSDGRLDLALAVADGAELVELLMSPPTDEKRRDRRRQGYRWLEKHCAPGLGAEYLEAARKL